MMRQLAASTQAGTERDTEKWEWYYKDDNDKKFGNDDNDDIEFGDDDGDVGAGGKHVSRNDGERETKNEDLVFEQIHRICALCKYKFNAKSNSCTE